MAAFHLIVQNLDGSISFENTNFEGSISFSQDTEGGGIDMLLSCLLRYFLGISSQEKSFPGHFVMTTQVQTPADINP